MDLPFNGCFFTWNNKRAEEDFVSSKLHRVMSNEAWLEVFGKTDVELEFQTILLK